MKPTAADPSTNPKLARHFAAVPPLENGDRLTRAEFYRRWEAMPRLKLAERIEGVVYMPAAIRRESHSRPHAQFILWLATYEAETPGVEAGDNGTVQLDPDNDAQPDAYLLISPEYGGRCRFTPDDYIEGGTELVGEIAGSSASRDLHQKLQVYRRNGVREYVVWKTQENEIVWYRLVDDQYVDVRPDGDGVLRSAVFPGLWLDSAALLRGDLRQVLAVLRIGLAAEEHRQFVGELQSRRPAS